MQIVCKSLVVRAIAINDDGVPSSYVGRYTYLGTLYDKGLIYFSDEH